MDVATGNRDVILSAEEMPFLFSGCKDAADATVMPSTRRERGNHTDFMFMGLVNERDARCIDEEGSSRNLCCLEGRLLRQAYEHVYLGALGPNTVMRHMT